MLAPSGWVVYAALASKLNVVPVIPGAAARTAGATSTATAIAMPSRSGPAQSLDRVLTVVARIAALLGRTGFGVRINLGMIGRTDVDLRHQAAEVLRIVRQVIEVGCVEIELLTRRVTRRIQNHVERFSAGQRD